MTRRTMTPEEQARLEALTRMGVFLDDWLRIPGTNFKIGLDGLLGLIPGVGDAVTALLGGYMVREAWRLGVPRWIVARMTGNLLLDLLVGALPVVGDLADFAFKSNRRNLRLLRRHLDAAGAAAGQPRVPRNPRDRSTIIDIEPQPVSKPAHDRR